MMSPVFTALTAVALFLGGGAVSGQAEPARPQYGITKGEPVRVGYVLDYAGGPEANENIAVREGAEMLLRNAFEGAAKRRMEITPYASREELVADILKGKLDMWQMSALDYASRTPGDPLRGRVLAIPQFGEKKMSRYVLLARKGTTLEELKDKRLRSVYYGELGQALQWLGVELVRRGEAAPEEYFSKVTWIHQGDPAKAILPTFFGEADAALVRDCQFDLLSRLNPQIGNTLEPVLVSAPVLGLLVVARSDYDESVALEMAGHAQQVNRCTTGKAGLQILKVVRFAPFEEDDLNSLIELIELREKPVSEKRETPLP